MSRKKQQKPPKEQKDFTILRLTITKFNKNDSDIKKREIFELKYKNVNDAKAMSQKINILLNSDNQFICFGPDDGGKQKCFNRTEIEDVLCEFIEDPQIEKGKTLLQEIKEKVDKIVEKQQYVPVYNPPWIYEPKPWKRPLETQIVTYAIAAPSDPTGQWYWTSKSGTKLVTEDNPGMNLTDSTTTITTWAK